MRLVLALALLTACGGDSKDCGDAVGHDEDGDGLDDGCDPCPYADDNVIDEDGDGLAGVCDPDPIAHNSVLKFIGFDAPDAELTVAGGEIAGDAFHVSGGSMAGSVLWGQGLDRVWVVAGIDVTKIDPTGFREAGVVVDAATVAGSMLPNGTYCSVGVRDIPEAGTDYIEVGVRQQPATDETLATDQAVLYLEGLKSAVIQSFHEGAKLECAFGVTDNRALISGERPAPATPGPVGVFGFAVDAKFSFMMIVASE